MRFDITHASYRVLERASKLRLPFALSEISAGGLLMALFEEEECRAAHWLAEAGLSIERFQSAFDLKEGLVKLLSPISAPPFPAGSYGVPPEVYQSRFHPGAPRVEASPAGGNAPSIPWPTDGLDLLEQHTDSEKESDQRHQVYSLYPDFRIDPVEPNRQSQARFFLDDQMISVARISRELESALETVLLRLGKRRGSEELRRIKTGGGAVTTILSPEADFSSPSIPIATEHFLLAVAMDGGDVGRWLKENKIDPAELFERIGNLQKNSGPSNLEPDKTENASLPDEEFFQSDRTAPIDRPNSDASTEGRMIRLLDAAANRAREAVRVVEDYVRFILNDKDLTRRLKEFRHEFQDVLQAFPTPDRLRSRDTEQDVGTAIEGSNEYVRQFPSDVLAANFGRLQESLRSLEEFSKVGFPSVSRRLERLRYRSYTLQKTVSLAGETVLGSGACGGSSDEARSGMIPGTEGVAEPVAESAGCVDRLAGARLYALVGVGRDEEDFRTTIRALIDGGVDVIQLRDKKAADRTLLDRARMLREEIVKSERRVLFVMNDRPDLAKIAGADGAHVGQDELSVHDVRKIVGDEMLVGVSTHEIGQARRAVSDGADYIGAGPVFASSTKSFENFPGIDYLKEVSSEIAIPAFAIGGITPENLPDVLAAGIHRIAVGAALFDAGDPKIAAERFVEILGRGRDSAVPGHNIAR